MAYLHSTKSAQNAPTRNDKPVVESSNPLTPTQVKAGSIFAKALPALLYAIYQLTLLSKTHIIPASCPSLSSSPNTLPLLGKWFVDIHAPFPASWDG